MTVPLNAYAGQTVQLRFHYRTDGGVSEGGFFGDEITVTADGAEIFSDGAEADAGWALDGFSVVGRQRHRAVRPLLHRGPPLVRLVRQVPEDRPVLLRLRQHAAGLRRPLRVPGGSADLLLGHVVRRQRHLRAPRSGSQPVRRLADPRPFYNLTACRGAPASRSTTRRSACSKADSFTLHINGQANYIRGQAAQPLFDDTKKYWYEELPNHGVKLPAVGVKIRVLSRDGTSTQGPDFLTRPEQRRRPGVSLPGAVSLALAPLARARGVPSLCGLPAAAGSSTRRRRRPPGRSRCTGDRTAARRRARSGRRPGRARPSRPTPTAPPARPARRRAGRCSSGSWRDRAARLARSSSVTLPSCGRRRRSAAAPGPTGTATSRRSP